MIQGRYHAGNLGGVYPLNVGHARTQPDHRRPRADVLKHGPGIVDCVRWRHVRQVVGHPDTIEAKFLCPHPLVRSFSWIRSRSVVGETDFLSAHCLVRCYPELFIKLLQ